LTGIDGQESLALAVFPAPIRLKYAGPSEAKKKQGQKPCFQSIA
jgi:hypothetical protein